MNKVWIVTLEREEYLGVFSSAEKAKFAAAQYIKSEENLTEEEKEFALKELNNSFTQNKNRFQVDFDVYIESFNIDEVLG